MAREAIYFGATAILSSYLVFTVLEKYTFTTKGQHLTAYHAFASIWLASLALVLDIICYRVYKYEANMRKHNCKHAVAFNHRDPIFGLDWLFAALNAMKTNKLTEFWDTKFKTVGSTYWVHPLGEWLLMTDEPENVKAILATNFDDWPIIGPRQLTTALAIGYRGIFSANGKDWQHARAMIRPSFVRNQIADLACFDRHVSNLIARIPKDGSQVDMQQLFYMTTIDSSTDFMFGQSTNTLTEPSAEAAEFVKAFEYSLVASAQRARLSKLMMLKRDPELEASVKITSAFADRFVAKIMKEGKAGERNYVFLNELIASGASNQDIREQVLSMILGGRDTIASTMSALFYTIARDPAVVEKLRAEINELNGEKPSWDQMKNMKYLNNVLKEILRLYPPVVTNSRGAQRDTVLPRGGGPDGKSPVFVPKGTICRWVLYSMHRRKEIYGADADDFRPERWEDLRIGWEYTPFSGGPRICIGQQFALTQMSYMLVRIFQTFKSVSAADDRPFLQKVGATTALVNDCFVTFETV